MKFPAIYIMFLFLSFAVSFGGLTANDAELEKLRKTYYAALENEEDIDPAIKQFKEIVKSKPFFKSTAEVYIGSLIAVKAKFAFWPGTKLEYANKGIDLMEKGMENSQNNIEALFIYGSTCYYLPFFFGKSDEAETALKRIVNIMDKNSFALYPKELLKNTLAFIEENIELDAKEKNRLKQLKEMFDE
jgi:hypothetical protein